MKHFVFLALLAVWLPATIRAADFYSAGSGIWSAPANWNPAGIPDPFAADDVTISGHMVDYDGGSSSGYLAAGNGHSITIGPGSLTQSGLSTPIIIGDGAGAVPSGTLRIQDGGLFDTGAAFGLIIGGSVNGNTSGDGVADIADGTVRIGPGATIQGGGIGVGLDGNRGVLNLGDGLGPVASALLDLTASGQATGARMGIGSSALSSTGGNGTLVIHSDGKLIQGTGTIFVGEAGGTGVLTIEAGGQLASAGGHIHIGDFLGASGGLVSRGTVSGVGELVLGVANAAGTATIAAGSFQSASVYIGRNGGSATLNVEMASLVGNERVVIGEGGGAGVVNLRNGIIQTAYLEASSGGAALNITTGTLRAHRSELQFLRGFTGVGSHSAIDFSASSLTIDANGFDIGIGQDNALTGTTLTKIGTGILTIAATQDYEDLEVDAGTVIFNSPFDAGAVNIHPGAQVIFTVNQSLTALQIGPNATAIMSDATNSPAPIRPVPEPGCVAMILLGAAIIAVKRPSSHRE